MRRERRGGPEGAIRTIATGGQVPNFITSPEGDLNPHLLKVLRAYALWKDGARGRKPFARFERFPSPDDPLSALPLGWMYAHLNGRIIAF